MAKLGKKQIKQIQSISLFTDVLQEYDNSSSNIVGSHWSNCPPDMWSKDNIMMYDMMNEVEMRIKSQVIKIVRGEKI